VAVLAVDPSSVRTGGSILGDKTRMQRLSADERAFIRPSPSAGTLGGVASRTRETMLLCEAAGYDVVLVETVGAGQSEVAVAEMTDTFLALMLPGAGDELQGIKKGMLELADVVAVNKADGDNIARAKAAAVSLRAALHLLATTAGTDEAPVLTYSALTGDGIGRLWQAVLDHRRRLEQSGRLASRRREQQVRWMWTLIEERFREKLRSDPTVKARLRTLEAAVAGGKLPPSLAADEIADLLKL
jgi:LAO/AO transport system kinase